VGLTTSVVTATASGQTAVGTFALQTVPAWAALRESQTVTISETPTATGDAGGAVKTAAVVVFAGGVAWFLASYAGEVGILQAPKDVGASHKDDGSCPEPRKLCDDLQCLGISELNMCLVSPNMGCACIDKSCPYQKLKCSNTDCQGSNGK
jgi:hypothetical protein